MAATGVGLIGFDDSVVAEITSLATWVRVSGLGSLLLDCLHPTSTAKKSLKMTQNSINHDREPCQPTIEAHLRRSPLFPTELKFRINSPSSYQMMKTLTISPEKRLFFLIWMTLILSHEYLNGKASFQPVTPYRQTLKPTNPICSSNLLSHLPHASSSPEVRVGTEGFLKEPGSPAGIQPMRTRGTSVLRLQMRTSSQKLSKLVEVTPSHMVRAAPIWERYAYVSRSLLSGRGLFYRALLVCIPGMR